MPRFFFNVSDQGFGEVKPDKKGIELPNLATAHVEAIKLMGELLRDTPDTFALLDDWSVDVRDDADTVLFVIQFSTIVAPAARLQLQGHHVLR